MYMPTRTQQRPSIRHTREMARGLVLALAVFGLGCAKEVLADTLQVELGDDIRAGEVVVVALYDRESNWLKKYIGGVKEIATANRALTVHLENLNPGRYAIAAYVDRNGNGKLGRSLFGIPNEPVGYSGAAAQAGPPDFKAAAFELPAGGTTIHIQLQ